MSHSDVWAIVLNLIADGILIAIGLARERLALLLTRHNPAYSGLSLAVFTAIWLVAALCFAFLPSATAFPASSAVSVLILSTVYAWFLLREILRYRKVGIRGADPEIRTGLDYERALSLCKNSLTFLGTGASKLTELQAFSEALARCRADRPIRLLLLEPSHTSLRAAAGRANRPLEQYRGIVVRSLQRISELRRSRQFNIEVRFAKKQPTFRLMFIDDHLCLVSFNEMGEGTGSHLPQLHVLRAHTTARSSTSFFHAFQQYFEDLWEEAEPWDFRSHLPAEA